MPIEVRDDKLRQLIVEIEGKLSGAGLRNAMGKAGELGVKVAKQLVRKDTHTLENSIYGDVISDNTLAIGTKVDYGYYNEYGSSKMDPQPFIEPGAQAAAAYLEQLITSLLLQGDSRGRPTTTGAGTYHSTGNKVGRPSTKSGNQFEGHKEASRPKGQHRYISKRKSPTTGKWIYDYGDQPRLRTARVRTTDRSIRRGGKANHGR